MTFSKSLAARVRQLLAERKGVAEKKMFGGVGFLLRGNLLVGIWQDSLVARLGSVAGDNALAQPHVRPFDITGRPMKGWVLVEPDGVDTDDELRAWLDRAVDFVASLPPK